ncbi:MAG: hypothetical protein EA359_15415 [Balneolaceae bacterium]|nr:MAG: hypothetical protein EA359_15415 [Balneolaceae bacterium]
MTRVFHLIPVGMLNVQEANLTGLDYPRKCLDFSVKMGDYLNADGLLPDCFSWPMSFISGKCGKASEWVLF